MGDAEEKKQQYIVNSLIFDRPISKRGIHTMFRRIALMLSIVAVFSMAVVVSAGDPLLPGCYVVAPTEINEGQTFDITVTCNDVTDNVFGFELATAVTDYAAANAAVYEEGSFVTTASEYLIDTISNDTTGIYVVSLSDAGDIPTEGFTLGSYEVLANKYLAGTLDDEAVISISNLELSTMSGQAITAWLEGATVAVRDIDLAAFDDGEIVVTSDGYVNHLESINLEITELTAMTHTALDDSGNTYTFDVPNHEYSDTDSIENEAIPVDVLLEMRSHLTCETVLTLADGVNTGVLASYTLYAGDVTGTDNVIDILDVGSVGAAYGQLVFADTIDINADGQIDIYDLVHVGRNYSITVDEDCAPITV